MTKVELQENDLEMLRNAPLEAFQAFAQQVADGLDMPLRKWLGHARYREHPVIGLRCEELLRHMGIDPDETEEDRLKDELNYLKKEQKYQKGFMRKIEEIVDRFIPKNEKDEPATETKYLIQKKMEVSRDGKIKINGNDVADCSAYIGKVFWAFANKQAGFVTYLDLNKAVYGSRVKQPNIVTQTRLRTYLTRARALLEQHFPNWEIRSYGKGKWSLQKQ